MPLLIAAVLLLAALQTLLTLRTIRRRRATKVSLGDDGVESLQRACHAWGVSRSPEDFRFRVTGMAVTFTSYIAAAVLLIGSLLS